MEPILQTVLTLAAKSIINQAAALTAQRVVASFPEILDKFNSDSIINLAQLELMRTNHQPLDTKAQQIIEQLLSCETIWNQLIAQLQLADNRGVMFIGPSGSGKTSLIKNLCDGKIAEKPEQSTVGIKYKYSKLGNRVIAIRDTAGRVLHQNHELELIEQCISNPPKILCIVLANGYLQTIYDRHLTRAGSRFQTLDRYLEATIDEEMEWVEQFCNLVKNRKGRRRKINNIIIIANKMDLWAKTDNYDTVSEKYLNNYYIKELVNIFLGNSYQPHFMGVASRYSDFQEGMITPSSGFSETACNFSVFLLRAYIHALLIGLL